jgi:branched-chain amino acid aminotransferase
MFLNFDGKVLREDTMLLRADNRGFRYGDGLFETMKVVDGRLELADYHFDRLFSGLHRLQFVLPAALTAGFLTEQTLALCKQNDHKPLARIRLTVFRGEGGLHDPADQPPHFIIQSSPLDAAVGSFNSKGWTIGLFPEGRKSCDPFSNLKSNNYLLYALAAQYARKQGFQDCLVLNSREHIADSSIANLFYSKEGILYTPPLSEGCVAGVMRRHLLATLPGQGFEVIEKPVLPADLETADEVFLTNALRGVQWVSTFGSRSYGYHLSRQIGERCSIK